MTANLCSICLRAVQKPSRSIFRSSLQRSRSFMTTPSFYAELPEPNGTTASSIPPVTPERAPSNSASVKQPISHKAAIELRKVTGKATQTYTAFGVTETLFKECASQANYFMPQASSDEVAMPKTDDGEDLGIGSSWWHIELGLKPTFSTWSQVTMLHMYILAVRFRCFPADDAPIWQQHLLDHFFYEAENKMTINHNIHARGTRNKYLKDLFIQWRGLLAAYDEGLVKGDVVLASAIWRNIFKADDETDSKSLVTIISYVRRALNGLDSLPDQAIQVGELEFGSPSKETSLIVRRSKMMDFAFKNNNIVHEHTR